MHQCYSDTSESSGALLLRVCSGRENTRARGKEDGIWQLTQDAGPVILVQSLSPVQLFVTPWTAAHQASLSFTISWSLLKSIPIELVILSNHLILCRPLLLLLSIFSSIRVFPNELALHIRWPKYWSCSFSISLSNEYSGLIFFSIDWFDLLVVQGTLTSVYDYCKN